MDIILSGTVIEKFNTLSAEEFEKWCKKNNLLNKGDGIPWSNKTHRGFTITAKDEFGCEVVYEITIRHHVKTETYYYDEIAHKSKEEHELEEVDEDLNRSIFNDEDEEIVFALTEYHYDSHFVENDRKSLKHGV